MNKKELSSQVAKQVGITSAVALQAIDAVIESMKKSLERGEPVVLQGFGSFTFKSWLERRGVNPSTKQPMIIPARKAVKFTLSKSIHIE